jgi:hypothetical protein
MSLSQRLKAAEYDRRLAAGLPVDHLTKSVPVEEARVDVTTSEAPVIDLTEAWAQRDVIPIERSTPRPKRASATTSPGTSEASAFSGAPEVGQRSRVECEQCGGPCQVDLVDALHQTVSLSCLSCYHMFRVDI